MLFETMSAGCSLCLVEGDIVKLSLI